MLKAITLTSELIKLEPMTIAHLPAFCSAGNFAEVWQHMPVNRCENTETARAWIQEAINEMAAGKQVAFIIIDKPYVVYYP